MKYPAEMLAFPADPATFSIFWQGLGPVLDGRTRTAGILIGPRLSLTWEDSPGR